MPTIAVPNDPANTTITIPLMQITLNDHITITSQRNFASGNALSSTAQIEDIFSSANSILDGYAGHMIDGSITANATAVTLANTTTSLGQTITPATLRYCRIYNPSTNSSIAFTSNITGFPSGNITPGGHIKWFADATNGLNLPANGTITATGANTTQTLRITMLVN